MRIECIKKGQDTKWIFELLPRSFYPAAGRIIQHVIYVSLFIFLLGGRVDTEISPHGLKTTVERQLTPNERVSEGHWIASTKSRKVPMLVKEVSAPLLHNVHVPLPRPWPHGYYLQVIVQQGGEGEDMKVWRRCVPDADMPEVCHLPADMRYRFPLPFRPLEP
jgi:hypothetical protein